MACQEGVDPSIADLESASRAGGCHKKWCRERESNPQRTRLQRAALPLELPRQKQNKINYGLPRNFDNLIMVRQAGVEPTAIPL